MIRNYRYWMYLVKIKISTYLFPIFFLIFFSILIAIKAGYNKTDNSILWRLGFYYYFVPFLCCISYAVLKVLNIFKNSEEEGVELILVSKISSRTKLIVSKFVALYSTLFLFSALTFIWLFLFSFVDKPSTIEEKIRFSGSYAVGTLIIMFLVSSIIIICSLIMNSILTIFVMSIFGLMPIATFAIAPATNAQHLKFVGTAHYLLNSENIKTSHVKSDQMFFFNPSGIATTNQLDKGLHDRMKNEYKEHKRSAYKYIAYVDAYQQLSGFLSIFQDRQYSYESVANWTESTMTVYSNYKFNINGWEYIYMYWNDSRKNILTASKVYEISKKASDYIIQHKNDKKWRIFLQKDLLTRSNSKEWKALLSSYIKSNEEFFDDNALKLASLIAEKENSAFNKELLNPAKIQDLMYIKGILGNGGKIPVYIPKPFIEKNAILLGWGILTFILSVIVCIIYSRRDFK